MYIMKTIDEIMFIVDGNNPFKEHLLIGRGGLGYKPYLPISGGGFDKYGDWIDLDDKKLKKKSDKELNDLIIKTNDDLHADYLGYDFDVNDKLKGDIILIKNEILNRQIHKDEKYINKQDEKIDTLEDEIENLDDYIDNKKISNEMKKKFNEEGISIGNFNWDKVKMTNEDIEKINDVYDIYMDKKQDMLVKLLDKGLIDEKDYKTMMDYPYKDIENIDKLLKVNYDKDIAINLNSIELNKEVDKLKDSYKKKIFKAEFEEKYGELPSKKFEKESIDKLSTIENVDINEITNINNVSKILNEVKTYNDFGFNDKNNLKLPDKTNADSFEYLTIGIKPTTQDERISNSTGKKYFIDRVELTNEFDDINQSKYDVLKSLIYTLDKDVYDKINKNTKVKVINYDTNTYLNGTLINSYDSNAPIDNFVEIKIGNDIYKYGIENKYYGNKINIEEYVKINDNGIEKFTLDVMKNIQTSINELFEKSMYENEGSVEYNKIMKKIDKLSKYNPNKEEILKEYDKQFKMKTINIKHTKTGLKPNLQYDPQGLSSEDYYKYLKNAKENKGKKKMIEFKKIIHFDNDGKIDKITEGDKEHKYTKDLKGAKVLYFVGCKNNINIGMNYSDIIKSGKVNKDNILATNRLVSDYYDTNELTTKDNHIAFRPDLFKTIKKIQ